MSEFGEHDPREMPAFLFAGALRLDYASAVRADPSKQNCSVCPRYWYVDAAFACARCGREFTFAASEQRTWYEEYGFWIDSLPKHCLACRRALRNLQQLRNEYDRHVADAVASDDLELKRRLAGIVDQLYELGGELPAAINEHRRRLGRQIAKLEARE